LTGVDISNKYRAPLDYPVATCIIGRNGLYGPTSSRLFSENNDIEFTGVLLPMTLSSDRHLNQDTLQSLRNYSIEVAQKVESGGYTKWEHENKAPIAGLKSILSGIATLAVGVIAAKGHGTIGIGNTVKVVGRGGQGAGSHLTPQQLNKYRNDILGGKDVHFRSRQDALDFINKKFPNFKQEIAGSRSGQGWHFDNHPINGGSNAIDHINIYSKSQGFRVHITWGN
jgi:hypothetical protein